MSSNTAHGPTTRTWRALLPTALFVALVVTLFPSSGRDDLHITFWPCLTLIEHGEMVNYNFERVEQTTTLALVLALAALHWVTAIDFSMLARILSILVSAWCIFRLARRPDTSVGAWLLATAPYFVYWAGSGMEATAMGVVYLAVAGVVQRWVDGGSGRIAALAALLATAVLLRSEAVFVIACGVVGATACGACRAPNRNSLPRVGLVLAALGAAWGALALFRYLYFGDVFPQPVHVKTGESLAREIPKGINYVLGGAPGSREIKPHHFLPLLLLAAWGLLSALRRGRRSASTPLVVLAAMLGFAQVGFAVVIGGDWMGYGRFLVPAIPCLALVAVFGLREMRSRRVATALTLATLLIQLAATADIAFGPGRTHNMSRPLWAGPVDVRTSDVLPLSWHERNNRMNIRDTRVTEFVDAVVAAAVQRDWPRPVHFMSGQMGFVPYHLVRRHGTSMRIVDLSGLTDPTFQGARELQFTQSMTPSEAVAALGGPTPDVVYSLHYQERPPEDGPFIKVYNRPGHVIRDRDGVPVERIREVAIVAVSRELHAFLGAEFFADLRRRMR